MSEERRFAPPDPHRILPQSPDAERGVLSSLLIGGATAMQFVHGRLSADHFANPHHGTIFDYMEALWRENEPIDFITLTGSMRDAGILEQCGGAAYITDLFTFLPTAANLSFYLEILTDKWWRRGAIVTLTELCASAYDEAQVTIDVQADVQRGMMKLCEPPRHRERVATAALGAQILERWRKNDRQALFGVSTGFMPLDDEIGGMCAGDLVVLAGGTSSGKSALALNIARDFAVRRQLRVHYFTLEMTAEQQTRRLVQMLAGRNLRSTMGAQREMNDDTERRFESAVHQLASAPITFDDERGLDITTLCTRARIEHSINPLSLVIIDYDELVRGVRGRNDSHEQEIASISRESKTLAGEINCPVILLSQVTTDGSGKVKMRWSAGKANDANTLLLIESGDNGQSTVGVLKNRDGKRGAEISLRYEGECFKFHQV